MVLDKFRLDGQKAVVTGASRGMGEAIALALAEAGADIAAVSRRPNAELEEKVKAMGRNFVHIAADLTQREQTKEVIPKAVEALEDVNILINNAGIIKRSPAIDYSEKDWDDTIEIDLNSAFILSQAAARHMMKKNYGKIISIASVLGYQGGMNVIAYATAKHGILGLTKALSNDWAKYGINVNAIAPSYIETELTQALQEDKARYDSIKRRTPIGRWGKPEDLEGAALFLSSPASNFVNGITLPVDGGWLAW